MDHMDRWWAFGATHVNGSAPNNISIVSILLLLFLERSGHLETIASVPPSKCVSDRPIVFPPQNVYQIAPFVPTL